MFAEEWEAAECFRERPLVVIRAADRVLRTAHHFSHESGAVIHNIPQRDSREAMVHVTRRTSGHPDIAGVKHHRAAVPLDQSMLVEGLPVLTAARTALDLARCGDLDDGVAACDHVLRHGVTIPELRKVLAQMPRWPGRRRASAAIDFADARAESYLESIGRVFVASLGLGTPEPQVGLTDGRRTVWCDLLLGRHWFEFDGRVKYRAVEDGGLSNDPVKTLLAEKDRENFITGFKLGCSRLTYTDLVVNRGATRARVLREVGSTIDRWGTSVDDLGSNLIRGPRPAA